MYAGMTKQTVLLKSINVMKFKNLFIVLVIIIGTIAYGQGPDPCPCDPTEGEVAYEMCLAAHPECDEDIPIDGLVYALAGVGLIYAVYVSRSKMRL